MSFAIDNALFQWEEGERRIRGAPELRADVERVVAELRRRLGSKFTLAELADLYAEDLRWATEVAGRGDESNWVVHAAFWRYAREASDFAGGRHLRPSEDRD